MAKPLPSVFIGSSVEGLPIAKAIQRRLAHSADVDIWDQATFDLSSVTIEALEERCRTADFAVFVLTPDDLVIKRKKTSAAARDNVIFELGLFAGTLGRKRCFLVYDGDKPIDLPTDLAGITPAKFRVHQSGDLDASLGATASQIEKAMDKLGRRPRLTSDALASLEAINAFCERVTGYWWERVLPDDASALSFVHVEPDPETGTIRMGAVAYHIQGAPVAEWYSVGLSIDHGQRKIAYIWEGSHPQRPEAVHQGFGSIRFDDAPASLSSGRGTYLNANSADPNAARHASSIFRRCADQKEIDVMIGSNSVQITGLVLEKLKRW